MGWIPNIFFFKKIKNPEMLIITLVFGTGNCKHISNLQHQAPWLWEFSSCTRRPLEVRVITWQFNFWKWYFTSLPYSTGAFTVCSRLDASFACSSVEATPSLVWLWSQGTLSSLLLVWCWFRPTCLFKLHYCCITCLMKTSSLLDYFIIDHLSFEPLRIVYGHRISTQMELNSWSNW